MIEGYVSFCQEFAKNGVAILWMPSAFRHSHSTPTNYIHQGSFIVMLVTTVSY